MKAYILFATKGFDQNLMAAFLNTQQIIRNWYITENILAFVSDASAAQLNATFLAFFGQTAFVFTESLPHSTGGLMSANFWEFVNNPKSSGYWESKQGTGNPTSMENTPTGATLPPSSTTE